MNLSRKGATILNIIVSFIYQLILIILGFIIPRLFLKTYGPEIHGLTSTITNLMNYVLLLNAGLNTVSIYTLYKPLSENNPHMLNQRLNAIKYFYFRTGIGYTIAILILSFILPYTITDINNITVFLLMIVMGLQSTATAFLISSNSVLLQADHKLYIFNSINIISVIIRGILQVTLLINQASVVLVQAIPALMIILTMVIQNSYINKYYPYLDSTIERDDKSLNNRKSAFIHQIAGLVVNNTDILLLTICTKNMVLVSIYSVYQLVFSSLRQLVVMVFSQGVAASFGHMMSIMDIRGLEKKYRDFEDFYFYIVSIIYSVTAVLILPFVKLYTEGNEGVIYVDKTLSILFLIIAVADNLRIPGGMLINAGGFYKETEKKAIIEAVINLVVSVILINFLGMYGLLIGTIASFTYRTIDIIYFSNKVILKKSTSKTILRAIRSIILIFINLSIFSLISISVDMSWFEWIKGAFIIGVISIVTSLLCIGFLQCNQTIFKLISVKEKIVNNL